MTLRVLIVEDEVIIGLLLGQVLADMGHDVCAITATTAEAIAAATIHHPDLMIVDINLVIENGIAAVEDLQSQSSTPCVFVGGDNKTLAVWAARGNVLAMPYQPRQRERTCPARAHRPHSMEAPHLSG